MYDTNTVGIVRKCFSERSSPELGFLRPHIAHDHIVSIKSKIWNLLNKNKHLLVYVLC
jgi:hypothetical protein